MKRIVVIYHGDCPDGFGGAWAAWKKFGKQADYIGAKDRVHPPEKLAGKEVYFIDWVYPLETMLQVKAEAKRVVALDHHETQEDATKAMHEFSYSVDNSGAVLAWKYFHPGKPVPKLLQFIEDYDLWRYKFKQTELVEARLSVANFEFSVWDDLAKKFENQARRKKYLAEGELLLRYKNRMVRDIADNAEHVEFEGHEVLAVNSPVFHSELGHELAVAKPPFGIVWRVSRGRLRVSLRSVEFDVAAIAQKYKGGGHRFAAGFTLDAHDPPPWRRIS